MIDVYFVRNGSKIRVQSREGLTAMEAAKFESHVPIPEIPADCGGCQACGTCHIHVDDVWCDKLKITENSLEQSLLEYEQGYIPGKSRLACQIQLDDSLNNVTVRLRKDELL